MNNGAHAIRVFSRMYAISCANIAILRYLSFLINKMLIFGICKLLINSIGICTKSAHSNVNLKLVPSQL